MAERIQGNPVALTKGQKVWLKARNIKISYSKKMTMKQEGPFEITETLGPNTFHLKLPPTWKIHNVFHAMLLTPYTETQAHGPNYEQPPLELVEGEEEYEIGKILKHHMVQNKYEFEVTWKGYLLSDCQWIKEADLPHARRLVQAYKKKHNLW